MMGGGRGGIKATDSCRDCLAPLSKSELLALENNITGMKMKNLPQMVDTVAM